MDFQTLDVRFLVFIAVSFRVNCLYYLAFEIELHVSNFITYSIFVRYDFMRFLREIHRVIIVFPALASRDE